MFAGTGLDFLTGATAWFSHRPKANLASFKPTEPLKLMFESTWEKRGEEQKASITKIVRYMSDEALIVPLFLQPTACILQSYVHTLYLAEG